MSGHRGFHRDLRGFAVTDFAHHDHVRVLAQDGPQAPRKGQFRPWIDLHLTNAVDRIFDRVFDGHDVAGLVVQMVEGGVKRGRLARSGWSGDQQHPIRPCQKLGKGRGVARAHPQTVQTQPCGAAVQKAHDHALAILRRDGGHPHVHLVPADAQRHPAILRQAFFGNVQTRHHLDPADQKRCQRAFGFHHVAQNAVDAEPDLQRAFLGFDVDVGRAFLDRLLQQGVDQPHDRGILGLVQKIIHHRRAVRQTGQIAMRPGSIRRIRGIVAVGRRQTGFKHLGRQGVKADRTGNPLHLGQRGKGGPGAQGANRSLGRVFQNDAMLTGKGVGQVLMGAQGCHGVTFPRPARRSRHPEPGGGSSQSR